MPVSDIKSIRNLYADLKKSRVVLTYEEFSEALGYHRTYISRVLNGHEVLTDEILDKINNTDFNERNNVPQETFVNEDQAQYQSQRNILKSRLRKNLTPVYNSKASAGSAILFQDRPELVVEYVDIPFIGHSDGVIEIVGDSMNPTYVNGTRIAVRKLEEKELVYPNECYYVIDINYDGRVKRLMNSQKKDHIILHSDNKEFPDVEFHWEKIIAVCKILCRIIKN